MECSENCKSCDAEKCYLCEDGYYAKDKECKLCIEGCDSCNNSEICDVCRESYFYINGKCEKCFDFNCKNCETNGKCITCESGFYKDNSDLCQPCPENCYYCLDGESCISCNIGYYLKDSVCTCLYPNGCPHWPFYEDRILHDNSPCDHGYYFLDGECLLCLEGCKRCYSITRCKKCYDDYDYVSGFCYQSDNSSISWGYLIQASFINLLGLLIS